MADETVPSMMTLLAKQQAEVDLLAVKKSLFKVMEDRPQQTEAQPSGEIDEFSGCLTENLDLSNLEIFLHGTTDLPVATTRVALGGPSFGTSTSWRPPRPPTPWLVPQPWPERRATHSAPAAPVCNSPAPPLAALTSPPTS